jgi:hypothetical protein
VKENDIKEIWNCKKMRALREASFHGDYERIKLCRHCSYIYEHYCPK